MDAKNIKATDEIDDNVLLTETVKIGTRQTFLTLTNKGLSVIKPPKEEIETIINWPDVVCVKGSQSSSNTEPEILTVNYIQRADNCILCLNTLQIVGLSDQCINVIDQHMKVSGRPRKLFVVVNPIGGAGNGLQIYQETVEPLFRLAEIDTFVVVTEKAKHALLIGESTDFSNYDGIVVVGGDGLYQELLQGLTIQEQKKSGINYNDPEQELAKLSIPIGIIPAGTGNAVSRFINGVADPKTAALNIIRGEHHNCDIFTVYNNNKFLCVSGFVVAYGMTDILVRAEQLRWMKRLRYIYAIIARLLQRKRLFQADLQYWPINEQTSESRDESSSSTSGWINHEPPMQNYFHIHASPWEFIKEGSRLYVNGVSQYCQLVIGTGCSQFSALKSLMTSAGGTCISKPGSLEFIKVRDFKLKVIKENPVSTDTASSTGAGGIDSAANRGAGIIDCDYILNIDGEVVYMETPDFIARLQKSHVPLFGSNFKL